MIRKYFKKIEKSLDENSHIVEDSILNTQTFTEEKGAIDGEVFFTDESRMDFLEVVNTAKNEKERYSYHYMDKEKKMIFRYDNAQHHRKISTFPHHKHVKDKVEPSKEPDIDIVLSEIEQQILKDND